MPSPRSPVEFVTLQGQRVGNQVVLAAPADGGNGDQPLLTDDITGALTTIPVVHHEVHEGETYQAWFIQPHGSLLADNAQINMVFTVGSKYPHFSFSIGFGGDCEVYLYRGPNFNLDGTVFSPHNLKDTGGLEASTVSVRINPTINNAGAEIYGEFLAGGQGGRAIGGIARRDTEDILRPNTSYLLRLVNRAGNAKQFSILTQWYEESDN